ncbi:MAG: NAD(P)-dependent oxidoreductase [Pseudomonadota bacterium]
MSEAEPLAGRTAFITGASRGIGFAIAQALSKAGANVAIAAKTVTPRGKLEGTIYSAAEQIEADGGRALPVVCDIRDEDQITAAVAQTVETFGGLDICINNASALSLTSLEETKAKRFDLMMGVNCRGTFLTTKACVPHLRKSDCAHVVMIAPPLDMHPKWFSGHLAYSLAKYGMSLCVLGLADELKSDRVAVNAVWPRTTIATAAVKNVLGGDAMMRMSRTPAIMGDAVRLLVSQQAPDITGQFLIDDSFLAEFGGVQDFDGYRVDPTQPLAPDFFVPDDAAPPPGVEVIPMDELRKQFGFS